MEELVRASSHGPITSSPGVTFVALDLLVRSHLDQIRGFQPRDGALFKPDPGFRPQLVPIAGQRIHIKFGPSRPARSVGLRSRPAGRFRGSRFRQRHIDAATPQDACRTAGGSDLASDS